MPIDINDLIDENREIERMIKVVEDSNAKMMHQLCILQLEHNNNNKDLI